jgi:hypothetical protein
MCKAYKDCLLITKQVSSGKHLTLKVLAHIVHRQLVTGICYFCVNDVSLSLLLFL